MSTSHPLPLVMAKQMCALGELLDRKGFFAATEGNISCRVGTDELLCTPSAVRKGSLHPEELCTLTPDGKVRSHERTPTSEIKLHLEIYRGNPKTQAVVHCHAPCATAFAISGQTLPEGLLAEAEYFLGHIPMIAYRMPGTQALADLIRPHAATARCAILRNHGAVSWGESLEQAGHWMEVLEAYCRTLLLARGLGTLDSLQPSEVDALRRAGGRV